MFMNLKDDKKLMKKFVKLVEKYPDIYDRSKDGYRTHSVEKSWQEIREHVRTELNEECTVEELKLKWKGIRSSYNRYKNKIQTSDTCKKYYLSAYLQFLDPFIRRRGSQLDKSETDCSYFIDVHDNDTSNDSNIEAEEIDIKSEVIEDSQIGEKTQHYVPIGIINSTEEVKQEKEERPTDEESEDLQFFKSILSDIKDFTSKEKRKFKMGILQLIDDIENERKDNY
ncbi:uncharacterized protein LOC101741286 [Bombyx mori]|uniref:MADF domain-containing protein n=1 Tax=Bombyx mori TaxID=7091 RepID=A0A8R2ARU1_BOMMO|nr:uncharacterized protein LOC101741286 [Bombyx mori]XP_004924014.1 uncharacterized protein LOC101741286 [Bombyx mori]XP_012544046.1 uncharacterized protein LOC101741286 [Bombyx mori]